MVGGIGDGSSSDPYDSPFAMVITILVDAVPGLRDVFKRQRNGEEFDVRSRWASEVDLNGVRSPVVLVDFLILDPLIGVEIPIPVDGHPKPIEAGIRSGLIIVRDPELAEVMQKRNHASALNEYRPLALRPPDPSPIVGVLQQRFDFPRRMSEANSAYEELVPNSEAAREFAKGTRQISGAYLLYRRGLTPMLILVDSRVGECLTGVSGKVEGQWTAATEAGDQILRFEAVAGGETVGRWILANPDERFVRAGASGAHSVVVLAEAPTEDVIDQQLAGGLHAWAQGANAFRALLSR